MVNTDTMIGKATPRFGFTVTAENFLEVRKQHGSLSDIEVQRSLCNR